MDATLQQIADCLQKADRIVVLTHQSPDGDTLGSSSALVMALQSMGKQAKVACSDPIPDRFSYLFSGVTCQEFEPEFVVSIDVAEPHLLGETAEKYLDRLDICLDHHKSNTMGTHAKLSYVDEHAAAACEIAYELICLLPVTITPVIADSLFTGVCTDTGCFRFSNTTSKTHRIAADLQDFGCRAGEICRELFDTKTKARILAEQTVLQQMEFFFDDQVALIVISQDMMQRTGLDPSELDGLASLPRQVQGVEVGVTLKERPEGGYKVSLRSSTYVDVSEICMKLGGGGHMRAAGCSMDGSAEEVKARLLKEIGAALKNIK
ncbi:MAG: DHH family phosphoesterase [Massiliimalia sp.]|jgi:phosphoesterase RecJ-like protein